MNDEKWNMLVSSIEEMQGETLRAFAFHKGLEPHRNEPAEELRGRLYEYLGGEPWEAVVKKRPIKVNGEVVAFQVQVEKNGLVNVTSPDRIHLFYKVSEDGKELVQTKEHGKSIAVKCEKKDCGYTTKFPLGDLNPEEMHCPHVFDFKPERGTHGGLECRGCKLFIDSRQVLNVAELDRQFNVRANRLADDNTRLMDESRELLAKIGRMSLELEKARKK